MTRRIPKSALTGLAQLAFLLTSIALIYSIVDINQIGLILSSVNFFYMSLCLLALFIQTVVAGFRQRTLLAVFDDSIRNSTIIRLMFTSQFFGQFLPGGLGGDAIKLWLLKMESLSLSKSFQAIANDRILTVLFQVTLCFLFLPILSDVITDLKYLNAAIGVLMVFLSISLILVWLQLNKFSKFSITRFLPNLVVNGVQFAPFYSRSVLMRFILLSLVAFFLMGVSLILAAASLSVKVTSLHLMLFIPYVVIFSSIPISIGGWGLREFCFVVFFGAMAVDTNVAVSLSIVWASAAIFSYFAGYIIFVVGPYLISFAQPKNTLD